MTVLKSLSEILRRLLASSCVTVAFLSVCPVFGKEKVDLLLVHGIVVTMDAQRRVIDDGAVAIRNDSIVAVGKSIEIESEYEAVKTINAHGSIIMPGLINSHAHAAMSLFRGIADAAQYLAYCGALGFKIGRDLHRGDADAGFLGHLFLRHGPFVLVRCAFIRPK